MALRESRRAEELESGAAPRVGQGQWVIELWRIDATVSTGHDNAERNPNHRKSKHPSSWVRPARGQPRSAVAKPPRSPPRDRGQPPATSDPAVPPASCPSIARGRLEPRSGLHRQPAGVSGASSAFSARISVRTTFGASTSAATLRATSPHRSAKRSARKMTRCRCAAPSRPCGGRVQPHEVGGLNLP